MSQTHAEHGKDSLKKQGDTMEAAIAKKDAVPMPEDGGHEKSHAAHLGGKVHEETTPADKLQQGAKSSTLREPPTVVQRVGKQHR